MLLISQWFSTQIDPLKGRQSVYRGSSDISAAAKFFPACVHSCDATRYSEVDKRSVFGKGNEFHATLQPHDFVLQIF